MAINRLTYQGRGRPRRRDYFLPFTSQRAHVPRPLLLEPVTLSDVSESDRDVCHSTATGKHQFAKDDDLWDFEAGGLPVCQFCGIIDDREPARGGVPKAA